jgi:predicted nuclease of restriction endonuclease-like (RecB) superfamily
MAKKRPIVRIKTAVAKRSNGLYVEVRQLILHSREQTAQAVNAALTMTYWHIGNRVHHEILKSKRAGYGEEVVSALARQLESEFGTSFGEKNLRRMIQFAEIYPEQSIVVSLIRQLSWTHFIALIPLKDPLQREFYAEMCRIERWSVRVLRERIQSMLYERTAISKKPEKLIAHELQSLREEDKLTPDLVFRDPYVLDFLGLKDTYSEKDLESAILREIESFLLELGAGFAFVERQKRITIDGDDYSLDLLFYHRRLRRLIAVELKLGRFAPADAGQVELYLRWLDRHERQPGEDAPVALILCAGAKKETAEYLDLGGKGIHVAEYLTQLPPPHLLAKRLHTAVRRARERLAAARLSLPIHERRGAKRTRT